MIRELVAEVVRSGGKYGVRPNIALSRSAVLRRFCVSVVHTVPG
jgi:hypothetical protein